MALGIRTSKYRRLSNGQRTTIDGNLYFPGGLVTEGNTFFADVNANAGGDGLAWSSAFNDLQDAIDATVAANNDIIYVARGSFTVTSTVNFNKSGISVIVTNPGVSPWASASILRCWLMLLLPTVR